MFFEPPRRKDAKKIISKLGVFASWRFIKMSIALVDGV